MGMTNMERQNRNHSFKLNRRDFVKLAGAGAGMAALPMALHAKTLPNRPPNIIVILADDMGFGDLACQNPESKIPTPNLDRLAHAGMRFSDAHAPTAVCTPTRYSILTGRYCWRSQLKSSVLWPWDAPLIDEGRLTLGGMLQKQGYRTACIGKWHLGWDWPTTDGSRVNDQIPIGDFNRKTRDPFAQKIDFTRPIPGGPTTRGFDYYFGDDVPNFPPYCFIENDKTIGTLDTILPARPFSWTGPAVKDWKLEAVMPALTQKAVDYIKAKPGEKPFNKAKDRPFFLYFPLTAPHTPIAPTDEFKGKSQAGAYGDYVYEVDWTVGRIMDALRESGQDENTIVIFTSDNGSPARDGTDMNGEPKSVLRYGHNPSHIYRGIKTMAWDGGHRVPFIAQWPGQIRENSVNNETVCLVDLMATCAALANCQLPNNAAEDSYNLLPVLLGNDHQTPLREATIHHSYNGIFAIRQGPWKLILGKGGGGWNVGETTDDSEIQLYNMKEDPSEKRNIYREHPDVVEHLTQLLEKYKTEGRSVPER